MINNHNLVRALELQYAALKALVLREILTRWGRRNFGFTWLFIEPILVLAIIQLHWIVRGQEENITFPKFGISIPAFIIIGYTPTILWRHAVTLLSRAILSNTALLHHRNLRPLDFYLARFIVECAGVSGAFIILVTSFVWLEIIPPPKNIFVMMEAWTLNIWFSLGFGLTFGAVLGRYEMLEKVWSAISMLLIISCGAFFYVAWLTPQLQEYALLIPMVHISELMKYGYFGNIIKTYENINYLLTWCLVLTFTGTTLCTYYGKNIPNRL